MCLCLFQYHHRTFNPILPSSFKLFEESKLEVKMVYGFSRYVWDKNQKSMKLPADYEVWIKTFKYPEKYAVIRTLDARNS
ncbi:hypothetical protein HanRHA438_Chr16g0756671 [Helianthus annuus]|uniref:Uncharacterized protein n=1 Tax=Helianthus annuus TaxID=4232 RepID=A0A251S1J7_HELAN|nr:hypothetical protein HanXRQr2_Chr16g0744981 [Helianthus annuus]KAJ0442459.1 hypothetical protein HanIR_Chr16g0809561 [Helianthus annuus]KAJ0644574.1 hypothetical protein HanOQP8_Chr16g0613791 [Helianthus annuus]KAJ0820956.1 hypothetical protein HanPSC8_Chr16g0714281 [Helianthus annuus]KAJ0835554.1 hypothetical protein HanRHA438_Chr16g0756671 [Helianthus annuus]